MSRAYEIGITVSGFEKDKLEAIQEVVIEESGLEEDCEVHDEGKPWRVWGSCFLYGGESDAEFAVRLAKAIFKANGNPCSVQVDATCMENLPCDSFEFGPEKLP